jgi:hypothetical protein
MEWTCGKFRETLEISLLLIYVCHTRTVTHGFCAFLVCYGHAISTENPLSYFT